MQSTRKQLLFILFAFVAAAACDIPEKDDDEMSDERKHASESVLENLVRAQYALTQRCVSGEPPLMALLEPDGDYRDLLAEQLDNAVRDRLDAWSAYMEQGFLEIDTAAAEFCIGYIEGLGCDAVLEEGGRPDDWPAACGSFLKPQQDEEDECPSSEVCKAGLYCPVQAGQCGACEPVLSEGALCDGVLGECDVGLSCEYSASALGQNACVNVAGVGESCATNPCDDDLECTDGVCRDPTIAAGEPCGFNGGADCAAGLDCIGTYQAATCQVAAWGLDCDADDRDACGDTNHTLLGCRRVPGAGSGEGLCTEVIAVGIGYACDEESVFCLDSFSTANCFDEECRVRAGVDERCRDTRCELDLYCGEFDMVCKPFSQIGESCADVPCEFLVARCNDQDVCEAYQEEVDHAVCQ